MTYTFSTGVCPCLADSNFVLLSAPSLCRDRDLMRIESNAVELTTRKGDIIAKNGTFQTMVRF